MYCNSILLIHSNMSFSPISLSSSLNCYWAPGLKSTLARVMAQFVEACPGLARLEIRGEDDSDHTPCRQECVLCRSRCQRFPTRVGHVEKAFSLPNEPSIPEGVSLPDG
jgi:hypothetical protein